MESEKVDLTSGGEIPEDTDGGQQTEHNLGNNIKPKHKLISLRYSKYEQKNLWFCKLCTFYPNHYRTIQLERSDIIFSPTF